MVKQVIKKDRQTSSITNSINAKNIYQLKRILPK